MERACVLQVTPGGKVLATIRARHIGSDEWFTADEFDVSPQLPQVAAAAQRLFTTSKPNEAPLTADEGLVPDSVTGSTAAFETAGAGSTPVPTVEETRMTITSAVRRSDAIEIKIAASDGRCYTYRFKPHTDPKEAAARALKLAKAAEGARQDAGEDLMGLIDT